MGGGESKEHHHYHTVYQTPPEVVEQLNAAQQKLQTYEQDAIDKGDPKLYAENAEKLLDSFLSKLPSLNLTDLITKETGEDHIGVLGPISSGKSTLLNTLFDLKLEVALGHCTKTCVPVHKTKDLQVFWDVPGSNDDYRFYKAENLAFVKSLDKCIILFDNDIAMISNIIKVVHTLNQNIILVRTKVDQYSVSHKRTISEEKAADQKTLNDLLGITLPIYYISSHNVTKNSSETYDWDLLKKTLEL